MTILEPTREITSHAHDDERRSNRSLLLAAVAVIALVLGGAIGWMVRGSGDDDARMVATGNVELTERQQDMVTLIDDYIAAWHASDGAAVVALFTPDGTMTSSDATFRVDDGTLEAFVDNGTWTSLNVLEPYLVDGDQVMTFHSYGGRMYGETLTFTGTGELLIESHVMHDG